MCKWHITSYVSVDGVLSHALHRMLLSLQWIHDRYFIYKYKFLAGFKTHTKKIHVLLDNLYFRSSFTYSSSVIHLLAIKMICLTSAGISFSYGCETSSLTLLEEHRLRMFKKRALRIFEFKKNAIRGVWKQLLNERAS